LPLAPHFKKGRAKLCRGWDFTGGCAGAVAIEKRRKFWKVEEDWVFGNGVVGNERKKMRKKKKRREEKRKKYDIVCKQKSREQR